MEQSKEKSSDLPWHLCVVAFEKEAFWSPSITVTNFTYSMRKALKHSEKEKAMDIKSQFLY